TVAFHLRNVFIKTGVSSRGELIGLGLPTRSADVLAMSAVGAQ
ncbi:MAG: hypothetical protein QOE89_2521, partial [Pseudonocardiales bacterium]|nr:hypothetical protein [Pseudonocardiales bacterium]